MPRVHWLRASWQRSRAAKPPTQHEPPSRHWTANVTRRALVSGTFALASEPVAALAPAARERPHCLARRRRALTANAEDFLASAPPSGTLRLRESALPEGRRRTGVMPSCRSDINPRPDSPASSQAVWCAPATFGVQGDPRYEALFFPRRVLVISPHRAARDRRKFRP